MTTKSLAEIIRAPVGAALRRLGLYEPVRRARLLARTWRYRNVDRYRVRLAGVTVEFRTDDEYSRSWFFPRYAGGRLHEPAVTGMLVEAVRPAGTFVDVGAHLGWYTCIAARQMPSGRVLSFEMDELSFALLRKNLALNGCTNVEEFNLAVSDAAGAAGFRREAEGPSPGLRLQAGDGAEKAGSVTVEAVTLDEFLEQRGVMPDVVKIDVEGAEMKVLTGMEQTLNRCRPILFLEIHPSGLGRLGSSVSAVLSLLFENGYRAFEIEGMRAEGSTRRPRPLGPTSTVEGNSMLYCTPAGSTRS